MNDVNKYKEVCDLLKIWFYIKSNNIAWENVLDTLEKRINILTDIK